MQGISRLVSISKTSVFKLIVFQIDKVSLTSLVSYNCDFSCFSKSFFATQTLRNSPCFRRLTVVNTSLVGRRLLYSITIENGIMKSKFSEFALTY